MTTTIQINGKPTTVQADPDTPILWLLRGELGLTGTKFGCGMALCGACTVHLDGRAVKACNLLALQAEGCEVTTIEGITPEGGLHPMQAAFRDHHGLQCGYCTPGMIMSALDLVAHEPAPSRERIREALEGNLCRCTGYQNIVSAVEAGARALAAKA